MRGGSREDRNKGGGEGRLPRVFDRRLEPRYSSITLRHRRGGTSIRVSPTREGFGGGAQHRVLSVRDGGRRRLLVMLSLTRRTSLDWLIMAR